MRTLKTLGTAVALFWLLGAGCAEPAVAKCSELEGAPAQKLLEYLQRERAGLDHGCVLYAMETLGDQHFAPAAKVLVAYLDFPPWTGDTVPREVTAKTMFYPAVPALSGIGKPAVPALVDVLGNPHISELVRKNAFQALAFVYRGDPSQAIGVLVRASRAEKDPVISDRLVNSAREAAARCPNPLLSACQSALQ